VATSNIHQGLASALIESIKTAGLVLVTDVSDSSAHASTPGSLGVSGPRGDIVPNGVDGVLNGNGVLRFNDSIDM
jgi:CDK inhibitor PHO81